MFPVIVQGGLRTSYSSPIVLGPLGFYLAINWGENQPNGKTSGIGDAAEDCSIIFQGYFWI